MQSVGAKVGGMIPNSKTALQLSATSMSCHGVVVADLFICAPRVYPHCSWREASRPEEDWDFTAQVLNKFGLVCRLNHLCFVCEHKQPGGDGGDEERDAKDVKACEWLQKQYPHTFRKKSKTEVSFIDGVRFIRRTHPSTTQSCLGVLTRLQ